MECLFCSIVEGKIPSKKVYEDNHTFAFLDINPASPGHTLVVPKKHYQDIFDVKEDDLKELIASVKKVAQLLKDKMSTDNMNILQNTGRHSGQIVSHIHFHLIPRVEGDGIFIKFPRAMVTEQDLDNIVQKMTKEEKSGKWDDTRW